MTKSSDGLDNAFCKHCKKSLQLRGHVPLVREGGEFQVLHAATDQSKVPAAAARGNKPGVGSARGSFRASALSSRAMSFLSWNRFDFKDLPLLYLCGDNLQLAKAQYRNITLHPWKEEFKNSIPEEPVKFRSSIREYRDSSGKHMYRELANYVLSCLSC